MQHAIVTLLTCRGVKPSAKESSSCSRLPLELSRAVRASNAAIGPTGGPASTPGFARHSIVAPISAGDDAAAAVSPQAAAHRLPSTLQQLLDVPTRSAWQQQLKKQRVAPQQASALWGGGGLSSQPAAGQRYGKVSAADTQRDQQRNVIPSSDSLLPAQTHPRHLQGQQQQPQEQAQRVAQQRQHEHQASQEMNTSPVGAKRTAPPSAVLHQFGVLPAHSGAPAAAPLPAMPEVLPGAQGITAAVPVADAAAGGGSSGASGTSVAAAAVPNRVDTAPVVMQQGGHLGSRNATSMQGMSTASEYWFRRPLQSAPSYLACAMVCPASSTCTMLLLLLLLLLVRMEAHVHNTDFDCTLVCCR